MRLTYLTITAAALVCAAPASVSRSSLHRIADVEKRTDRNERFSLSQVANSGFRQHDAPGSLIMAHAKYSNIIPPTLKEAIEINAELNAKFGALIDSSTGSTKAMPAPMSDSEYVIPVSIGTPPQEISMNLDTGSSDFWAITSDTLPNHVGEQKLFRPENSTTAHRLPDEGWEIKYGDGSNAIGIVYTDRVEIGGTSFDSQAVQSAVDISFSIASDSLSSGIIGMALGGANTVRPDKQKTYFDNIKDTLEQPLFTANLQKGRPGSYNFGYIDQSEYQGTIQYASINPNSPFWMISVSGYQIGQDGTYQPEVWNSIVDTGTSLLLTPQNIVDQYYDQVPGSGWDNHVGMVVFPCSTKLPDFVFGLGEYRGLVPGHYMNYAQSNNTHCYGGIQASAGAPFSILGDILLKAQFVVFNIDQKVVGFANKETVPPTS